MPAFPLLLELRGGKPPLQAWGYLHDSHGIVVKDIFFLEEGDKPEGKCQFVRLPWLDQPSKSDEYKLKPR
jgi:hypothetical protein